MALWERLRPCGPVVDAQAAERVRVDLATAASDGGWGSVLEPAWPALAPIAGASAYLATLMRREPQRLAGMLQADPGARLELLVDAAFACEGGIDDVKRDLRLLKAELHLLTALCDLGGVWNLDQVTAALTDFADACVGAALRTATEGEIGRGRLLSPPNDSRGPVPGLFVLALGKHGAGELNYSSDIDVTVFYEPHALPAAPGVEPGALALRLTQTLAKVLQERTAEGYVFRVDLRLRPDPSSTPAAVPVDAALDYYETVGQNWERAAFIKARPCGGDLRAADAFLAALQPFVWRRHLDYAAIADIHSIKRQIHVHHVDERVTAPGADLKLGRGGIREIEFYVQTQQLILGGRGPHLRSRRTLDAVEALADAGHVTAAAASELSDAYRRLRAWEHRVQMLDDEQTHTLPEDASTRARVAALAGAPNVAAFDAEVGATLERVNARYGELFAQDEDLSSSFGSLVFTGVEDDPETLATLARMGFTQPGSISAQIRSWHHGRISATRTSRGRELFTRLAPRLLEACEATGAPDVAFSRFAAFFTTLLSGVQVQSLFLAQPGLFGLIVEVFAFAPELAATLSRRPAALDALLDPDFFTRLSEGDSAQALAAAAAERSLEPAMDAARRAHREQAFRIGVQVMSGAAEAGEAGRALADLADACVAALALAALVDVERLAGAFPGEVAVIALGKFGSREMTARSDLDLMTLYAPASPTAASEGKGWGAETFYARFTQRLVAALSAPTAEGGLYEVDLQLRPSGTKGPVAVSAAAFEGYYAGEAETWEELALTRARVVWASSPAFAERVVRIIEAVLRRPRNPARTAGDVAEMRSLMQRERPSSSVWDLKLTDGGLVDIEFCAQHLQLVGGGDGGPLAVNTGEALEALNQMAAWDPAGLRALLAAWRLQQDLSQVLAVALPKGANPRAEPERLRQILAKAGGEPDFASLERTLGVRQAAAHEAFLRLVGS